MQGRLWRVRPDVFVSMPTEKVKILFLRRSALAAAALCFSCASRLLAGPGAGTTSANFLKIPVAVIPTALAESYTALSGPDSILYNPAGLGLLSYSAFSGTHNRYLEEITQEYAALAYRSKYGTVGAAFSTVASGKITAYDVNDMVIGETSTSHQLWILSFAQSWPRFRNDTGKLDPMLITPSWSRIPNEQDYRPKTYRVAAGASVKKIIEKLDNVSGSVYTFDAGAVLVLPGHLQLGASALNITGKQKFMYESYALPKTLRVGAASDFHTINDMIIFTVATDMVKYSDAQSFNTMGIEADFMRLFQLRAGYRTRRDIGARLSAGFGLNFDKFAEKGGFISGVRVDYSYLAFGDLGNTHRFGLQLIW
jgi:hypothetical protein